LDEDVIKMKTKIVLIFVLATLLVSSLSVSGLTMQKNEMQSLGDPAPRIHYIAVYSSCKKVDWGYAKVTYKAYSENEIGGSVDMVFDWGDGTTSTYPDITGGVFENHEFERAGTFSVKVKYGGYNTWSEPVEFPVVDHCDLEFKDYKLFTEPSKFGKNDKIDIKATVVNVGTISTTRSTTIKLYEGYNNYYSGNPIKEITTGIIDPGEEVTITLEDFKWYGDEVTHSFCAEVEPVPYEIDFTDIADNIDDPNLNNFADGHFTAPKIIYKGILNRLVFLSLFEKIQTLRNLLS
jgi:hypothetical protein